jgi:hypothetical protein
MPAEFVCYAPTYLVVFPESAGEYCNDYSRQDANSCIVLVDKLNQPTRRIVYSAAFAWTAGLFGCVVQSANGRA